MSKVRVFAIASAGLTESVQVFVVATSDNILSSSRSSPQVVKHDATELLAGWSGTLAAETNDLDSFARALADDDQPDLTVYTAASEVVPGGLIDGYISEQLVLLLSRSC